MTKKYLLYTAGPYRDPRGIYYIQQNIQHAAQIARQLWLAGYAVICPHTNTALMDGTDTDQMFLTGDFVMIKRCDFIVMLPGWRNSIGSLAEHELAINSHIPIFEWPHDEKLLIVDKVTDEILAARKY